MYRVLKRWYISDGNQPADMGWECLGVFRKIRKARQAMHRDIKDVEKYNCYRDPAYGGKNDTQRSLRHSRDRHVYDMADCNNSHIEWEVSRIPAFSHALYDYLES